MGLKLWADNEQIAAPCVTGVLMPEKLEEEVFLTRLRDRYGVMVSGGYGPLKGKLFRLGHMGPVAHPTYITAQLAMVERTLADLNIPIDFGKGVGAAINSLSDWNNS